MAFLRSYLVSFTHWTPARNSLQPQTPDWLATTTASSVPLPSLYTTECFSLAARVQTHWWVAYWLASSVNKSTSKIFHHSIGTKFTTDSPDTSRWLGRLALVDMNCSPFSCRHLDTSNDQQQDQRGLITTSLLWCVPMFTATVENPHERPSKIAFIPLFITVVRSCVDAVCQWLQIVELGDADEGRWDDADLNDTCGSGDDYYPGNTPLDVTTSVQRDEASDWQASIEA